MNNSFDPVLFIFGFQPILLSAYFGYRQIWYLWFLYPIFASFSVQCLVLHCHIVFYFSFLFINKLCGKTCISASHIKGLEINRSKPEQTCWKWCNFKLCWKLLFSAFFLSLGISQEEEDHEGGLCEEQGELHAITACLGCRAVWLEGADFHKDQGGQALHRMRSSGTEHQSDGFPWLDLASTTPRK